MEHAAAEKAAEEAKIREAKYEKLSMLCGISRVPMIGDYFRSGVDGSTGFVDRDIEFVAGKINPKTVLGPILDFDSFRKDTSEDFFAGLSVMIMHQTPPDANQKVTEFEAWVKISENSSWFCELVDKPQLSIWDEPGDAEEPSTSSGSGLRRE